MDRFVVTKNEPIRSEQQDFVEQKNALGGKTILFQLYLGNEVKLGLLSLRRYMRTS